MILKTAKQIIMEYIKDLVIIKECPEGLYTVSSLLKRLKESGDKEACLMLKYHCDIIDKNLFSSIIGSLLPGIRIEEGISDNQYDLRHNEGLIEELRILINHNKAISLADLRTVIMNIIEYIP